VLVLCCARRGDLNHAVTVTELAPAQWQLFSAVLALVLGCGGWAILMVLNTNRSRVPVQTQLFASHVVPSLELHDAALSGLVPHAPVIVAPVDR